MGARKPGFLRKYFKRAHKTSPIIIVEQASLRPFDPSTTLRGAAVYPEPFDYAQGKLRRRAGRRFAVPEHFDYAQHKLRRRAGHRLPVLDKLFGRGP
jgi:hypothetical protein